MKKREVIRLTKNELQKIVKDTISEAIKERKYFNHQQDAYGSDFYETAKIYASSVVSCLELLDENGKNESFVATHYTFDRLQESLNGLVKAVGQIKKYCLGFNKKGLPPTFRPKTNADSQFEPNNTDYSYEELGMMDAI